MADDATASPPGSGDERDGGRPRVRRVDERLGLAIDRAGLSGQSLVTYARDHVTVRTPSRPDFRDGNTLDLVTPPAPGELDRWLSRFAETTGRLGVAHVQLRWETPLPVDAPAHAPDPDPALAAAVTDRGFALHATTVLLLHQLTDVSAVDAELAPVAAPSAVPGATPPEVERRWHAAAVLDRYATGDTPDDWRAAGSDFLRWAGEIRRELAVAGRAVVWTAQRHGAPVGRLVLLHDRQGLAVVEDVVVHPVHRRRGIGSALTHAAVAAHLAADPHARVGIVADPGSSADRLYRRLGFTPHATVWTAVRAPSAP